MIIHNLNNPTPYGYKVGQAVKIQAPTLPPVPQETPEVCPCEVVGCEQSFKVFGHLANLNDDYKNDKTSILLRKFTPSDNLAVAVERNGVEVGTINLDPVGDYFGAVVNWGDLLSTYGAGFYQFRYDTTIIGVTTSKKSVKYHLLPFSDESANGTVRLTWMQSGSIRSNAFDFTGLDWVQQIRFSGQFWNETPTLEVDNYVRENYKREQIQDRLNFDYDLDLDPLPVEIGDPLIYNAILGNKIEVTDYNLSNYKRYINYLVVATAVDTAQEWSGAIYKKFIIKFTKRFANDIKTNYGE